MTSEIRTLIEKPENFEYAWAIYEEVRALRRPIFLKFWQNVGLNLQDFIEKSGHNLWYVYIPALEADQKIGIWLGDINSSRHMGIVGRDIFGKDAFPYISLYAGEVGWSANAKQSIEGLRKSCGKYGLKPSKLGENVGWFQPEALKGLKFRDRKSLVILNQDRANEQNPLSMAIARDMWSCFEKCRSDLEAIWRMG